MGMGPSSSLSHGEGQRRTSSVGYGPPHQGSVARQVGVFGGKDRSGGVELLDEDESVPSAWGSALSPPCPAASASQDVIIVQVDGVSQVNSSSSTTKMSAVAVGVKARGTGAAPRSLVGSSCS